MSQYGQVLGCWVEPVVRTSVATDAGIGDTELEVVYAGGFPDEGTIDVAGVRLDYTSIVWGVSEDDPDTIILSEPLADAIETDDPVSPVIAGAITTEHTAEVVTEDGDTIMVPVPYAMRPMWPEGIYEFPLQCEYADDGSTLENAPGRDPVISGRFLDPTTLPERVPAEPPAESPTLAVVPMSKGLLLNATGEVETTTWLLYEVATDSGFSSVVASTNTRQSSVVVSDVPEETDLWARVTAYNEAGAAAPSASVGPVQTLILGVADLPDLADAVDTANQAILDALAAAQAAQAAQDTADGAIRTFYQEDPPWADGSTQPASSVGDLWYREPDGAVLRWTGTTWSLIPDTQAAAALAAAEASSKVYIQPTAPTGRAQDLWIDTTGGSNTPKRWNGSTWVATTDKVATDAAAAVTALDGRVTTTEGAISSVESRVTTAEGEINTIETRMDTAEGSITTLSSEVTSLDSTVSSHTTRLTTAEGEITTLDGRVDNAELSITSHDTRLDDAESDIVDIITVQLPGKSKSTYSTSAPGTTPNTAGDLWWHKDSTTGEIIGFYEGAGGTSWVERQINGAVLNHLDAGTITVGTLAAARIGADTIDSTKIVTAGLDAGVIKFGTMSGDRIEAGSLTIGKVGGLQSELDAKASAAALAAGLENKVVNGGFEDGLNGWTTNSNISVNTDLDKVYEGSKSAQVVSSPSFYQTGNTPVSEGQTWRWSCWYKTSAGYVSGSTGIRPLRYPSAGGGVSNIPGYVNFQNSPDWSFLSFEWTVEPGYDRVTAFRVAGAVTAGEALWIDDARCVNVTDLKALEAAANEAYTRWAPEGETHIEGGKITTHSITSDHIVAGGLAVGTITGLQSALDEIDGDLSAIHIVDPIPTMSSNSPSAGRISWTSFDVRYGGVTTTVPPGDTANRYVIYRWNSGTPTVEQTNTKPILGAGDFWLFSNLAGVPVRIFASVKVDGDLLVEGSVTADALAANTITADEIAGNTITSAEIATGAITAAEIASDAITGKTITGGTINGTDIIGSEFRTSDTGERVVVTPGDAEVGSTVAFYADETTNSGSITDKPARLYVDSTSYSGVKTAVFTIQGPHVRGEPAGDMPTIFFHSDVSTSAQNHSIWYSAAGDNPLAVHRFYVNNDVPLEVRQSGATLTGDLEVSGNFVNETIPWTARTSILTVCRYKVQSGFVIVDFAGSLSVADGAEIHVNAGTGGPIPANWRPAASSMSGTAFLNERPAMARVDTSGRIYIRNFTGATRTFVSGQIMYPVGS